MVFIANDSNFYQAIAYYFDNNNSMPPGVNGQTPTHDDVMSIETWNTTNVTNMSNAFINKTTFNADISQWNTSSVTDMNNMFNGCSVFNQDIGNWDTANVIFMYRMFANAYAFNQNIGNWDTSKVVNMNNMFNGCSVFNQDIGNWDTANVTDMNNMFNSCIVFNQDISKWHTNNVTDMNNMFNGASSFIQYIRKWHTDNVTFFSNMFLNATEMINTYTGTEGFGTTPTQEFFKPLIPEATICFPGNTPILTDQGIIQISNIDIKKNTINNENIKAITKTISNNKYFVCIEKDAFGDNIPNQTTYISKHHKILHNNGKMYKAFEYLNKNKKIYKVDYNSEVLYNILLEEHSTIKVNNLICETLHPENQIAKLYLQLQKLEIKDQEKVIKNYNNMKK